MRVRQIAHMDVIPDAGAIFRRIVFAEDGDALALLQGSLEHERNQMAFGTVVFTDLAAYMGACGVEIAKRHIFDAQHLIEPGHHPLHRQLRLPVYIGRLSAVRFFNRHLLRFPVSGCCRREDDLVHARLLHAFEQALSAIHIVVVVFDRVLHALANQRAGREMNDRVDVVLGEQLG
ncbi:hypothetical protein D3C71_1520310 [compost metagenome]